MVLPNSNAYLRVSFYTPLRLISGANPFPEVTDQFCRLPLPTLIYRLEAAHLGHLLRLSVRLSVCITFTKRTLPRRFKDEQK